ncbi:MAG: SIR2 family protein [Pseudomonadota bacterium]|nr:SIR2 family protein [Pseudomonadota bacterium]
MPETLLPIPIKNAIERGNAILFLGAGASYDALQSGNTSRISAEKVKEALSDQFLGGKHKDRSLMIVADYARSESSLVKVQSSVRNLFIDLEPASFHLKIPTFRWRAIVTTNYDLVIEKAYAKCKNKLQDVVPVTRDGDELQRALSGQNTVPYLKLHGCINNYLDTNIPLVLDSNEYAKFKTGRQNLVRTFSEWATESPIIFCGYSLNDENIKEILFDIGDTSQHRDAYLFVDTTFDEIQKRYWLQRRIIPFTNTFEGFLNEIDDQITPVSRKLGVLLNHKNLSILKWIPSHVEPSENLAQYLNEEVLHVLPNAPVGKAVDAESFYCGLEVGFGPIYEKLDIRRSITDKVLERVVLDTLHSTQPKLFIIKGYAGSGKSVLAKRVAVETTELLDVPLVVWINEGAVIRPELLFELQELVEGRIFIFVDDLIEHQETFTKFIDRAYADDIPLTVIACARTNELQIYSKALQSRVTGDFELEDLENSEVMQLLEKLSNAKILGPLRQYNENERRVFIQKLYEQQLLVALHEITFGDSFESIVVSEFEKILPREAQQLYLDICTLHQCGVGVRAGLVSRISGIPISELNKLLNGPLSRVIRSVDDKRYRDIVYRSRHSEIARMVFTLAIQDPATRAHQLVRIISKMDLDYSSDSRAFFELVRGKRLAELFDKKELALDVFAAASKTSAPQSFLAHQRAILELNHPNGNLNVAMASIREAEAHTNSNIGFHDTSLKHTKANLLRKRALSSSSQIERERYRADARSILKPQLGSQDNSYPEHLYGQLLLDEIKEYFSPTGIKLIDDDEMREIREESIVRVINDLTLLVDDYLRRNPSDGPMTLLRSDFLRRIGQFPDAVSILERFHNNNPDNTTISRVLAEALSTADKLEDGLEIMRVTSLSAPGDMAANLVFAKLLAKQNEEENAATILSQLRRSFSDGDTHYEARLLYARANLLYGDVQRGNAEFELLRKIYVENHDRPIATVELPGSSSALKQYSGTVLSKKAGYGFIKSPELRFNVYFKKFGLNLNAWNILDCGTLVTFHLAFNYSGPVAIDIEVAS